MNVWENKKDACPHDITPCHIDTVCTLLCSVSGPHWMCNFRTKSVFFTLLRLENGDPTEYLLDPANVNSIHPSKDCLKYPTDQFRLWHFFQDRTISQTVAQLLQAAFILYVTVSFELFVIVVESVLQGV